MREAGLLQQTRSGNECETHISVRLPQLDACVALQGPIRLEDLAGSRTFFSVSRLTSVCTVGTCLQLTRGRGTNGANSGVLWQIPVWWIWCTGRSPGVSSMP